MFGKLSRPILLLAALLAAPAYAANPADREPTLQVGILLFDEVQIIDFSAPYEAFGHAGFGVVTISAGGHPVTTAMGLKVTPDHSFANAPKLDVLLVPGGEVGAARKDPQILEFVRERSAAAQQVLSVCTGSHILAGAGVLDGLRATTFHQALDGLGQLYPNVKVVRDVRWVDNGKVITSAGLSSGIDAALHLIAKLRGEAAARTVALHMEYDWDPNQGFVRTRLADQYLPELNVEWPKDANFVRQYSFGDEKQWQASFRTTTKTPVADLMQLIAAAVDGDDRWQRAPKAGEFSWERTSEGKRLQIRYRALPVKDGDGHDLMVQLQTIES